MPYWRLSWMYFLYFGVIGAMTPFWSLYLQDRGFNALYIGLITATPFVIKLVMPTFWGFLADVTGRYIALIRVGAIGSAAGFLCIVLNEDVKGFLLGLFAYSFFWNAVLSQLDTATLSRLGRRTSEYGRVRVWGSVGFVCSVFVLGWYFDHFSISYLPLVITTLLVLLALCSCALSDQRRPQDKNQTSGDPGIYQVLMAPDVLVYFIVCFLLQLSLGAYYVFFSIYLADMGYSKMSISVFWVIGVVAEILIFIYMPNIFRRFSLFFLMLLSLVLTSVRWAGTGLFADFWYALIVLQVLHAFTFGVSHSVGVEFVRQRFSGSLFARGQALFITVNYGAGMAVGASVSGLLWAWGGGTTFLFSACVAGFSALLFLIFFRNKQLWRSCVQSEVLVKV